MSLVRGHDRIRSEGRHGPSRAQPEAQLLRPIEAEVLALQRTRGNAAVARMVAGHGAGAAGGRRIQRAAVTPEAQRLFLDQYPLARELIKGVGPSDSPDAILQGLVRNLMATGFEYTMFYKQGATLLKGTMQGDCATLSEAVKLVAIGYFGLDGVGTDKKATEYFVPGGGRVLDKNGSTGNVDDGAHWKFTEHTWVTAPGGTVDVLFRGAPVDKSKWIDITGSATEEGIGYDQFGDLRIYDHRKVGQRLATRYTTDIRAAREGAEHDRKAIAEMSGAKKPGSRCFLTTACVAAKGLGDDCRELTTLRAFRDGPLARLADGPRMIAEYYEIAPRIVARVEASREPARLFAALYPDVAACVALVEAGRHAEAIDRYRAMVTGLARRWLPAAA